MFDLPVRENAPRLAVYVKRKAIPFVTAGHPWLFADSIEKVSGQGGAPGDIAVLFDANRAFIGAGLYDPASPVRVKIFSNSKKLPPVGPELFLHSARAAAALRSGKISGDTDAWRMINGDSDAFPGMVADKYANALVCKFYSAALLPWAGALVNVVAESVPGIDSLVIRLSRELQKMEDSPVRDGMIFSLKDPDWDAMMQFRENGIVFEADLRRGQKTGFFLDQRENRSRTAKLAAGKDVLNVFSYSGGFSLYAAQGGAKSVTSVDLDPHAIALCDRNFSLNPALDKVPHQGITGDAFEVFAQLRTEKRLFDMIVVDPPSFAKSASEVPGALHSYARLAKAALRVLKKNGILVFASCSSRVDADTLFRTVCDAAAGAGRRLNVFDKTFHAPDHPAKFNESHYLKCLYAEA